MTTTSAFKLLAAFAAYYAVVAAFIVAPKNAVHEYATVTDESFEVSDAFFRAQKAYNQAMRGRFLIDSAAKALEVRFIAERESIKSLSAITPKLKRWQDKEIWIITPHEKHLSRPKLEPFEPIDTGRRGRVVLTSKGGN